MKTIIISICLIFTSSNLISQESAILEQIAALKIKHNITQGKELAESIIQYEQILEQGKILKEMRDVYNEISEGVKKYSPVINSVSYMYKSIDLYKEIMIELDRKTFSDGSEAYSKNTINSMDKMMMGILESNTENIKDLKAIMKSGEVKMNDGERMEIATEIEKRTSDNYLKLLRIKKVISKSTIIY